MVSRRQEQIAELLQEELVQLIQYDTQDPRLGFVTVTGVEITPDLGHARVYLSIDGDEAEIASAFEGLASAAGYYRRQLAHSLHLRYVPDLSFHLDDSLERGARVEALLDQIQQERAENPPKID